jgi:hypothetical protein
MAVAMWAQTAEFRLTLGMHGFAQHGDLGPSPLPGSHRQYLVLSFMTDSLSQGSGGGLTLLVEKASFSPVEVVNESPLAPERVQPLGDRSHAIGVQLSITANG